MGNEIIEFKDELLWELVKAEESSNLQVVGWKILQSAHERSDAPEKLQYLIDSQPIQNPAGISFEPDI
ncbi:hypothetical protein [Rhizobium brockwellii]